MFQTRQFTLSAQHFSHKTKSAPTWRALTIRTLLWLLAGLCFWLVYRRLDVAAAVQGQNAWQYLLEFFQEANWLGWLSLMIPYSIFFFLVDSHAIWRTLRWFNAPAMRFSELLPIRASAYILSLLNEQVGKGALALYLLKHHGVPLGRAISSMLYLGMAEIYQLLIFSAIGIALYFDFIQQTAQTSYLATIMLSVIAGAVLYFPLHVLYFSGRLLPNVRLREASLLHAFRQARLTQYILLLLFKAPNLIAAVVVYTLALEHFNVAVNFGQMLAFLPVIFLAASLPLPFHAGGLLLWTLLYPEFPEVSAFALVMSVFFVGFNAVIGVLFLPKVSRVLLQE